MFSHVINNPSISWGQLKCEKQRNKRERTQLIKFEDKNWKRYGKKVIVQKLPVSWSQSKIILVYNKMSCCCICYNLNNTGLKGRC